MWKNRVGYGVMLVLCLFLLLFYHNYFFFLLFLGVLLLPVFSYLVGRYVFRRLSVTITIPVTYVEEGNEVPIRFTVDNPTVFPMPGLHLHLTVANQFYPNEEQQDMALPVHAGKRTYHWGIQSVYAGRIGVHATHISMRDYLGMKRFFRSFSLSSYAVVVPEKSRLVMNMLEYSMSQGEEQEMDVTNSSEDVTQVKEIREYKPGDRLQRVHWKLSTKTEDLFVKEYEREFNRTLTLLVELKRDSDKVGSLNDLLKAFYSTAVLFLEEELKFQVQWYDVKRQRFETARVEEEEGLVEVLQQIFMMEAYEGEQAYMKYKEIEHGRMDMTIYFTSMSFTDFAPEQFVGTLDDKVMIVCL